MIRMNDFGGEPEALIQAEVRAAERVIRSGWYVLGTHVERFEKQWAERCGVAHAVGVGNGLDAIEIGVRLLGLREGDEVITTPTTAFATILGILRAGATPVLADIDPESALLDLRSAERSISDHTKAILLVHMYGQMPRMDPWVALCRDRGLVLAEDCAQAHAASVGGKVAGSFGAWGAYSFYPTKNLGAIGDAGALVTNDLQIGAASRVLRNYGQEKRYEHIRLGMNSRLDELQAALLEARLPWLDGFIERRRAIAGRYREGINNRALRLLAPPIEAAAHVYHLFVVICEERDRLAQYLKGRGIETLIHYPIPAHMQPPCGGLRRDPRGLASSEKHAKTCLSIPCHPQLSDADVGTVIEALNAFR